MSADDAPPCLSCGACCKSYRVSFYWAEALELGLPDAMTEQVCGVYAQRPSACREVQVGDGKCNGARERHGLEMIGGVA
jgi:Fe-S-cluster containining protein